MLKQAWYHLTSRPLQLWTVDLLQTFSSLESTTWWTTQCLLPSKSLGQMRTEGLQKFLILHNLKQLWCLCLCRTYTKIWVKCWISSQRMTSNWHLTWLAVELIKLNVRAIKLFIWRLLIIYSCGILIR